jgi:hypothetical protein
MVAPPETRAAPAASVAEPEPAAAEPEEQEAPSRPSRPVLAAREEPREERAMPATEASAAVRQFYSALSRGDGRAATQLVVPGKRNSGPLSGSALTRYYSSLSSPLQIVSVRPMGPNTVQAEYRYRVGSTQCRGRASVDVSRDGDGGVLIERIRTNGPC